MRKMLGWISAAGVVVAGSAVARAAQATPAAWLNPSIALAARTYCGPDCYAAQIARIPDGRGGEIVAATINPYSADGLGDWLYLWHDGRLDYRWRLSTATQQFYGIAWAGAGVILLKIGHYAPGDGLCCPSLPYQYYGVVWTTRGFSFVHSASLSAPQP